MFIVRGYVLWTCDLWLSRSLSRDGPINIDHRGFYRSCAVIYGYRRVSRHGRENQHTVFNFSIWKVADVGLYRKAVLWQRNRAKFIAASRGPICDSTTSCVALCSILDGCKFITELNKWDGNLISNNVEGLSNICNYSMSTSYRLYFYYRAMLRRARSCHRSSARGVQVP